MRIHRHTVGGVIFGLIVGTAFLVTAQSSEQVNTTAVQTLTNKTLTNPTINAATVTGTIAGGASYTSITLPSPTISGTIGGSATWPDPGAIGAGTPAPGRFSTLTATTSFVMGTCPLSTGTGSPEGVVTSIVCGRFLRTDGGTGTTLYLKETGAGNTGWVPISAGGTPNWAVPGTIGSTTPNTGAFTTLSVTGQFTSTVSTGTAPYVVASTTKVTNLNADFLDGADWAAPSAIGSTTPAAITGTTVTATTCFLANAQKICSGTGTPEGVVTAPIGSLFMRSDGAAGTTLYSKIAGSGNTGWAVVAPASLASPGPIGGTTPDAGAFTSVTTTNLRTKSWSPPYGATVTIDMSLGSVATITATNATDFLISNPTNSTADDDLTIRVKNTTAGALGIITFDTDYKMVTYSKPSAGKFRWIRFKRIGSVFIMMDCGPEIPNEP